MTHTGQDTGTPYRNGWIRAGSLLAAVCLALLGSKASWAGEAPFSVDLQYSSERDCPDQGEFKAIVTGRLGYDPFREGVSRRVLVQVVPHGRSFEGHVEWRDAVAGWQGDRVLPSASDDCRDLVSAMAFALALQIQLLDAAAKPAAASPAPAAVVAKSPGAGPAPASDDGGNQAESPPAPPGRGSPVEKPPVVAEVVSAPASPAGAAPPTVIAVGVGGWAGLGMSSGMVAFGRVFGSIAWQPVSLELAAELGPPATIRRRDGAGVTHQELLASLAICGSLAGWAGCAVGKGGEIRISGQDVDFPATRTGPFLQAGLRLARLQQVWRGTFVAVKAEGLVTLTRPRVTLDQFAVWTSSRFAGTLGLDVGVRFQ